MVMSEPFTTTSPNIASYSYTDLISGLGIRTFYGLILKDAAGEAPVLTTQASSWVGGDVKKLTKTFKSSPFTSNEIVAGYCDVLSYINAGSGDNGYIKAELYYYDKSAGTTTSISDQITATTIGLGDKDAWTGVRLTLTETKLKVGDELHLEVYVYGSWKENEGIVKAQIPFKLRV